MGTRIRILNVQGLLRWQVRCRVEAVSHGAADMIRTALSKAGAALTLALCLAPRIVLAQTPAKVANPDDTREANVRAYVELLRSDIRSQKIAIITELMAFTEDEDAKFWPV